MTVHFSPEGQCQWLDSDEFSSEFLKLLGAAQEGGSMVSECFLVASRIDPNDRANSWHRSRWNAAGRRQSSRWRDRAVADAAPNAAAARDSADDPRRCCTWCTAGHPDRDAGKSTTS